MERTEEEKKAIKAQAFKRRNWRTERNGLFDEIYTDDFGRMIFVLRFARKTRHDYYQAFVVYNSDLKKQIKDIKLDKGEPLRIWYVWESKRAKNRNLHNTTATLMEIEITREKEEADLERRREDADYASGFNHKSTEFE